jgi:hypothetical protein
MIATFPLYLTFIDLIKLKLCGKQYKFYISQILISVQSALISPHQTSNKCRFIHTFITKLAKLLVQNNYDKLEEPTPE